LSLKFNFDEEIILPITSPFYPKQKYEEWWILIGDLQNNKLISIKRLSILKSIQTQIEFIAPDVEGKYNFKLYFICDSYLGCDQIYDLPIFVKKNDQIINDDDGEEKDEIEEDN
jgi:pre-mRNA-splicing helicase BRR2